MNTKILKGASILTAVLMVSMLFSTVLAGPVQPFNRWGYAYDNGGTPLDTQDIYAWIDGVSYGTDVTGTGADVGLFSIDCYGDDTTPDGVKTGGYNGDTVFYTHGDLTTAGIFFAETDSWIVGGFNVAAADINEVAATPALLKIDKVCSQRGAAPDDYIAIYNPSGAAVDVTGYSIAVGGGAPMALTGIDAGAVNPLPAAATGYIDMTAYAPLSTTGNSLTLSETATGFIVDRVEYGAIGAEPENTIMNNAPAPGATQEIYRVPASGADTNDCLVDFTTGPETWPSGVTATATGPVGLGPNALTITYTTVGSPATVECFYSENGGPFVSAGIDLTPLDGFPWVAPGVGGDTYDWICNVPGGTDDGVGIPGGPPEAGTYTISAGGVSPTQIWVNKSGAGPDVIIEWSDGVAPFEVFISNNVDGSGFNFAVPDATGIMVDTWTHAGVLGDGMDYSYIVRGVGDPTNSEIGWKNSHALAQPGNPNINWVSIPYVYQYSTLGEIGPDVGDAISWEIRCWDLANQQFRAILWNNMFMMWLGDTAYVLQPGDSIMVFVTQAAGNWDICGAHDSSMAINIQQPGAPNINWISIPYHHNYATLGDVGPSVGDAISWEIRCWDVANQQYRAILWNNMFMMWLGDTAYALAPGDALMVFCTQAPGLWTPTTNPIV